MPSIIVELPSNRTQAGTLRLEEDNGSILAGPFPVLGRADKQAGAKYNNRDTSPARPYGNTPLGEYKVRGISPSGPNTHYANEHSYGSNGVILLEPISEDAAVAKANGRTGLLIHGGAPGVNGGLRPTNGCIRLFDNDMATLLSVVRKIKTQLTCRCVEIQVSHTHSSLVAPDDGYDEGDPPPMAIINVIIRFHDGSNIRTEVASVKLSTKISKLRTEALKRFGVQDDLSYSYYLLLNGLKLDNKQTIQNVGLQDGSELKLKALRNKSTNPAQPDKHSEKPANIPLGQLQQSVKSVDYATSKQQPKPELKTPPVKSQISASSSANVSTKSARPRKTVTQVVKFLFIFAIVLFAAWAIPKIYSLITDRFIKKSHLIPDIKSIRKECLGESTVTQVIQKMENYIEVEQ